MSLRRIFIYTNAQILSVNITHGLFVSAEEIWPHGVFLDERRFPQTPGRFPVALAQQLFTFVFQIICKHKESVDVDIGPLNTRNMCDAFCSWDIFPGFVDAPALFSFTVNG